MNENKTRSEEAVEIFTKGFNCAQAVLLSHCEDFGLNPELAKKIAGAFGSGMGQIGEVCGAVTGALMVIGLKHGKYKENDNESKDRTYNVINKFTEIFKKEFNSINCTYLCKYDLSINAELLKAREAGVFRTVCPILVKRSVEILEEVLGI